jgi:hypothetical protein
LKTVCLVAIVLLLQPMMFTVLLRDVDAAARDHQPLRELPPAARSPTR